MSNEAEDPSRFAVFPREGLGHEETSRLRSESGELEAGGPSREPEAREPVETKGNGNLGWGVLLTVVALILSGVGHRLAPVEARVSLVTGGVLVLGYYVMTSIRVFVRPNGFFLGLSLAFLIVAVVPVGMSVWQGAADYASRIRVAAVADVRGGSSGTSPGLAAPLAVSPPSAVVTGVSVDKAESRLEATSEKPGAAVNAAVNVGAGEVSVASGVSPSVVATTALPVAEKLSVEEREAKIAAMAEISAPVVKKAVSPKALGSNGLPGEDVSLGQGAAGVGSVAGLSQKEFNERVLQSKLQVVQRYPALGRNGSDEVKVYTEVFNELVRRSRDFFLNPDWPLELAELVGKREGWIPEEGSGRK